jgi:bifunctional DNA-binding transcriptional regulator/antitoxin component of YhaV-PrlF toxin-antitoxin module
MSSIEFKTKVTNGSIVIPDEYRNRVAGDVRVIIRSESAASQFDMIEQLLENPLKIEGFTPLTREAIYEQR